MDEPKFGETMILPLGENASVTVFFNGDVDAAGIGLFIEYLKLMHAWKLEQERRAAAVAPGAGETEGTP